MARTLCGFLLSLTVACGFPRPPDVGDDAADAGSILYVSPDGSDANDGALLPVRTLRRAIGLATANAKVVKIALASGTYGALAGETFPYAVPSRVVLAGPAGGGAVLLGTKVEPGLSLDSSGLHNVDLQNFTTAITATGATSVKNVRVLGSTRGVQAETTARLTVDNLEIAGIPGACSSGILLIGSATFTATGVTTRNLETALTAEDLSHVDITNVKIDGDRTCTQNSGSILVRSGGSFIIKDGLLDNGTYGILIAPRVSSLTVMISNTIIRNMKFDAMGAQAPPSAPISFHMIGGEMSGNDQNGAQLGDGTWRFTDVRIQRNSNLAIYLQDGHLILRDCKITGNGFGINIFDNASADLGTGTNAGNNEIRDNTQLGLLVDGIPGGIVEAVGNTWRSSVQGADENGKYLIPQLFTQPVPSVSGNNYAVGSGRSLRR